MSGRPLQILGRLPAHLEAARPGKQFSAVVEAIAGGLDLLSADLAAVRRAHRLGHADTLRDLLLLGGLHGLTGADLTILLASAGRRRDLAARLEKAIGAAPDERDAAAEALFDLWGVDQPRPRLALFAPAREAGEPPDLEAAGRALAAAVRAGLGYRRLVDAARTRVGRICQIHAGGNGTIRAILAGAANALDLEIDAAKNAAVKAALQRNQAAGALNLDIDDEFFHSQDRFWHSTFVRDRAPLVRTVPTKTPAKLEQTLPVVEELLGVEENPLRREPPPGQAKPVEGRHGHLFTVLRRGFGRELLQVRVDGREGKTVGPMIVNRDEGHGVGYFGAVPAGQKLVFMEEGRVLLEGADVTSFAFSWQGACFADEHGPDRHDFLFDGPGADPRRRAAFAVATPDGALDRDAAFPHAGLGITAPGVGIGVTRMAFFVQQAHLSSRDGPVDAPQIRRVTPHPSIGFADQSVFAPVPLAQRPTPDPHPASDYEAPPAADLYLSWLEHEAYALRVIIPRRFALLDGEGPPITRRVADALGRFRPAGVEVRVEYHDDRWLLGRGFLLGKAAEDPNLRLRGGTVLSAAPADGP